MDTAYSFTASSVSEGNQSPSYNSAAFSPQYTSIHDIFFCPEYAFSTAASITFIITGDISIPIPSPSMNGIIGSSGTFKLRSSFTVIFDPTSGILTCL